MSETSVEAGAPIPTALVTGAAGGIGAAIVARFLASGMRVLAMDRDAAALEALRRGSATPSSVCTVCGDVANPTDMRRAVTVAIDAYGGIDTAVMNAGIEGCVAPVDRYPTDEFLEVLRVNVRGVWCGLQASVPELLRRGGGSVVVVSSISGLMGFPGVSAYTASKHAVIGLVRSLALEVAPQGIRVNAVAPGFVSTRMTRDLERKVSPDDPAAAHESARLRTPLQRYARPREVASLVSFLCSADASFCSGGVYTVDGGFAT